MKSPITINKKHAVVASSLVLFLIAISLGMFAIAQPTENVAPAFLGTITPKATLAAVAHPDWKEYSNPAFGYSLKYPPNMVYREWQPAADILQSVSFYLADDIDKPLYLVPEISVSVFANPNKQSAREWMLARSERTVDAPQRGSGAFFEGHSEPAATSVGGVEGVTFAETVGEVRDERAVLSRNNTAFSMAYTSFGDPKLKPTHNDMVSTLRWSTPQNLIQFPSASGGAAASDKMNDASFGPVSLAAPTNLGFKLPWTAGESYRVGQTWGGSTHRCPSQSCYAYDFDNGGVPFEGVPVRASNDGTVAFVKGDTPPNTCGGYDYRKLANYVTVYHPDGTATLYLHLKSVSVGAGPLANGRGTIVGLAGKTGWTGCYAHLHFARQAQGAWAANSVQIYFDEYPNQQLKTSERYTSQNSGGGGSTCSNPSPSKDQIGLYEHASYCGAYKILGIGEYPNPASTGFPNDSLSSVKVGSGVTATLCRDDNFAGGCVTLFGDNPNLRNASIGNDQVSSVKVAPFQGEWKGEYFNNQNLSGTPALVRSDSNINFDWGYGSPGPGIGPDHFAVRWTRTLNLSGGTWRFTATADDGVKLWVDDRLVIDKWVDQRAAAYSADVALSAGNHTVKMEYYENAGNAVAKLSYTSVNASTGSGWRGQYYNNMTLSGSPILERDDPEVNFNWGAGSPAASIGADRFSVRWTRTLNLVGGTWRFTVTADDGVRLWVDDRMVIDKWVDQSATSYSADVALGAGNHAVKMEYYENSANAVAKLSYSAVTAPSGSVWRGQYYNNMTLAGAPALERDDPEVNFDWGTGAPGAGIEADRFSVRWMRTLNLAAGTWRFTVTADDGVRLWVDDRLVIDKWFDQRATSYSVDVALGAGNHAVKIEYYENGDNAVAKLSYSVVTAPPGSVWRGQYFNNMTLEGTPALERDDAEVNFNWGRGSPGGGVSADRFSARWTRTLSLASGTWRFTTTTDDGVRLWVDDQLLIDKWSDQGVTSYSADVALGAGNHTVKMEYYDNAFDAVARLSYSQVSAIAARPAAQPTVVPTSLPTQVSPVPASATPTPQAVAAQATPTANPTNAPQATATPTQVPTITAVPTKPGSTPSWTVTLTPRPVRSPTSTAPKPTSAPLSTATPTPQAVALQTTPIVKPSETPRSFEIEPPQEVAVQVTPAPNPSGTTQAPASPLMTLCGGIFGLVAFGIFGVINIGKRIAH